MMTDRSSWERELLSRAATGIGDTKLAALVLTTIKGAQGAQGAQGAPTTSGNGGGDGDGGDGATMKSALSPAKMPAKMPSTPSAAQKKGLGTITSTSFWLRFSRISPALFQPTRAV